MTAGVVPKQPSPCSDCSPNDLSTLTRVDAPPNTDAWRRETRRPAKNFGCFDGAVDCQICHRAANPRAIKPIGGSRGPSRGNDNAFGPCVDQRAAMANALHPDAIVSIDADGGPPEGRGFHVNYSNPPLNDAQPVPPYDCANHARSVGRLGRAAVHLSRLPTDYTGAPIWPT